MRLIDHFDNGVAYYPDSVAFIDIAAGGTRTSYREAHAASKEIASGIRGHGYDKGSHIGILAPNGTPAFLALLGLFRAEGVWLPINPRNATAVNIDLLTRFDAELLFYHSSYEADAGELLESVPTIRKAVCLDSPGEAGPALEDWGLDGAGEDALGAEQPDDLLAIFPTGGTTGKSKGVMISHHNIQAMLANFYTHLNYHDDTCHLVVAPMTHSAGLLGCMHFARGGTNAIMAKADPLAIMQAMETYRVTHLFLPPTVLYMMLAHPAVREYDYSSLRHFLVGAAPTSLEKLKEAVDVFGPVMSEAFGQAEAPGAITVKAPWDYLENDGQLNERRLHSVGRPCVHNQVVVLDDDGVEVPRDQAGEICVRGELVTPGYYKNDEETAKIREFGWHHTGDIGVMADDGYITIVDRKKDMIITGGFNVFPNEIEQVLTTHPAVQDCSVIGVPDEKWGEAVKAVVQRKPDATVDADELIALVKDTLGSVKAPKSVDFIDDLPRSPAGKVLKVELRARYWHGRSRRVN